MNQVILIGRLTKDPEIRMSASGTKVARYTLAVDRWTKDEGSAADFFGCIAFSKSADFAELYLHKGMKIAIAGRIQTGSYTNKDGQTVYTTDVVVNNHEFCESRGAHDAASAPKDAADKDGFMMIPDGASEIPW